MNKEKHEFALYVYGLSNLLKALPSDGQLCIKSKEIQHRISRVLRLQPKETLVLFDRTVHAKCILNELKNKHEVDFTVIEQVQNKQYKPHITFFLPLLKHAALQDAIYGLIEAGINDIQLVTTEKSNQRWHGDKEFGRLERIMIAAAEQAKNFSFAQLKRPISLLDALDTLSTTPGKTIFFDPTGKKVREVIASIPSDISHLTLLIGPEADLSEKEKEHLKKLNIEFCALTPTILRAQQAAIISAGLFRSFF